MNVKKGRMAKRKRTVVGKRGRMRHGRETNKEERGERQWRGGRRRKNEAWKREV